MAYRRSSIISRRIPSGLGYVSTRTVQAHTVRGGMGAVGVCSDTSVVWDPAQNACVPPSEVKGCAAGYVKNPYGYCVPKETAKPGILDSFFSAFTGQKPPTPMPGGYMPPVQSGMSQGTMIALGVGAVGLLALVMLSRK